MARNVNAGRASVRIGIEDRFTAALKRAQRKMQDFAGGVSAIGKKIAIGGAAIAAPLAASLGIFADYGDKLHKMSARTGIAVESLSELGFAAEQSGANLDAVSKAVLKMNRRVGRLTVGAGSSSQVEAIEKLGLSIEELAGMNPEERFLAIGDAIATYGDQAAAAGLAQRAFGTEIDKILPMLLGGADAIKKLRQEARELGIVFTGPQAEAAAAFTDAWNRVKKVVEITAMKIGGALAPAATKVAGAIKNAASMVAEFVENNRGLVVGSAAAAIGLITVGGALVAAGLAASALSALLGILSTAYGVVTGAASAAWTAILGPFGLVIGAFALLLAAMVPVAAGIAYVTAKAGIFGDVWDYVSAQFKKIWGIAKATFGGISDALMAGEYLMAAKVLWAGLKVAFYTGLTSIRDLLTNSFSLWWDAFKRFGKSLLQTAWDVFKAIPSLLWKALSGGNIAGAIAGMFEQAAGGLDESLKSSQAELGLLMAKADAARKKLAGGKSGDETSSDGDDATPSSTGSAARGGDGTPPWAAGAGAAAPDPPDPAEETQKRIDTIREEIATLKYGRDALQRYKLAQMGATDQQLRALKAAQAARNQAKQEKALADERKRRVEQLQSEAKRLNEAVRSPMEVFRDEVRQLRRLRKFGLTDEAYREQYKQARQQLDQARGVTDDATAKITNRGTFSGFNVGLMGGRNATEERIAEATSEVAANTKRTAEAMEGFEQQRLQR